MIGKMVKVEKSLSDFEILTCSMKKPYWDDPEWKRQRNYNWNEWRLLTFARWRDAIQDLFPNEIPSERRWSKPSAIASVLDTATRHREGKGEHAYLLYPRSGDMGLSGAEEAGEVVCVALQKGDSSFDVLKPESLEFVCPNRNALFSYFWLAAGELSSTGVYSEEFYNGRLDEPLCEPSPGSYLDIDCWINVQMINPAGEEVPLPEAARRVTRYMGGDFLIVCKSSPYN